MTVVMSFRGVYSVGITWIYAQGNAVSWFKTFPVKLAGLMAAKNDS